jgi:putative multiple sugar transport system permease protein
MNSLAKKMFKGGIRQYTMLIALVTIMLVFTILSKGALLYPMNVSNIISQNAYVVILAVGMLMCILTGGNIDLSIGAVVGLVMACAGTAMMDLHIDPVIVIPVSILIGILIGAFQGYCIAYVGIPPFIVTLAGMLLFRGITGMILGGETKSKFPDSFMQLFNGNIPDYFGGAQLFGNNVNITCLLAGVLAAAAFSLWQIFKNISRRKKGYEAENPLALTIKIVAVSAVLLWLFYTMARHHGIPTVLITVGIVVACYTYITGNMVIGRHLYALGGNAKAAWLSGVNTKRLMFLAYTNNGFLAGVAGLVCLARFTSAFPNAGTGFEMDAIAACFIGGASAYGGIGTVPGALIGALIMGMLNLGMSITGVDQFMQQVTKGLVLLVAVAIDVVSKNRFGFDQAAQFASWVKELFRPGSREKPIRTKLAGVIAAILGAIILAAGIYGFIQFPALNAAGGLLELVKTAAGNKESGIIFTSEQMRQLALVNYRVLATVLGGLGIISGVLLRLRKYASRTPVKAAENAKS